MKKKIIVVVFILIVGLLSGAFWTVEKIKDKSNVLPRIPKVIHYVWLGSKELPEKVKESVASWQKYQPDFKIKRWDEESCDINSNFFVKTTYERRQYDYASDYCRVKALQEGGIYFDTDMVLKAPIASLLDEPLVLTLQRKDDLSASFMAAVPNHPFISSLKQDYEKRNFLGNDAPTTWSSHFKKLFSISYISVGREDGKYHIVARNILMYDFGGGENVAEHFFGAGSVDAHQSAFYEIFRKTYLDQFALYIPSVNKYLIFKNEEEGYLYDPETNKAAKRIEVKLDH